jgi:transposase
MKKRRIIMSRYYEPEFKHKIVRLHLEEGRTMKSITAEYGVSKASISKWCEEFRNECQNKSQNDPTATNDADLMNENLRLRRENEEMKKEILFLKKAAAFFAKEIG